ncbi:hypothetical protein [Labrenzia sp. VG12]|uniref:hypothetical protein n=1 Tax=Labrenzia sp. VG12 TaxID=2021862 RepID=UPI000B8BBDA0|nr:hypothetical protein [Labrenzia sp. VG12]ASP34346.1 hypothetical protein CHH27_14740 [Labrenzia sp. VG12]
MAKKSDKKQKALWFHNAGDVPVAPAGFEFVSASVSTGGEGLFLFIEAPFGDEARGTFTRYGAQFPEPRLSEEKIYRLVVVDGWETSYEIEFPPLDLAHPLVDLFADGRVLIAGSRAAWHGPGKFDLNGAIFDPLTGNLDRFLLGDGIESLGIDGDNRIWVSYFDEGVCGNLGWNGPGPWGLSSGGLVCFDVQGEVLFQFNTKSRETYILDCYALNVSQREVWAYYSDDFDICRVDGLFSPKVLKLQDIEGSSVLAVADAGLVLGRQYHEPPDMFHLVRRDGDWLEPMGQVRGRLPEGTLCNVSKLFGRGRHLHVINGHGWFRADISELFCG